MSQVNLQDIYEPKQDEVLSHISGRDGDNLIYRRLKEPVKLEKGEQYLLCDESEKKRITVYHLVKIAESAGEGSSPENTTE